MSISVAKGIEHQHVSQFIFTRIVCGCGLVLKFSHVPTWWEEQTEMHHITWIYFLLRLFLPDGAAWLRALWMADSLSLFSVGKQKEDNFIMYACYLVLLVGCRLGNIKITYFCVVRVRYKECQLVIVGLVYWFSTCIILSNYLMQLGWGRWACMPARFLQVCVWVGPWVLPNTHLIGETERQCISLRAANKNKCNFC